MTGGRSTAPTAWSWKCARVPTARRWCAGRCASTARPRGCARCCSTWRAFRAGSRTSPSGACWRATPRACGSTAGTRCPGRCATATTWCATRGAPSPAIASCWRPARWTRRPPLGTAWCAWCACTRAGRSIPTARPRAASATPTTASSAAGCRASWSRAPGAPRRRAACSAWPRRSRGATPGRPSVLDQPDRRLRTVRLAPARVVLQVRRHLRQEQHAVAAVVLAEEVGGQRVAAPVAHAARVVELEPHAVEASPRATRAAGSAPHGCPACRSASRRA